MTPYILSIVALILVSRRAQVPAALMIPFNKGER
jgi:simple sugar transport system permease protein